MIHFTIEEMNLISIYQSETRALLIETLTDSLAYMDDDDMIHLAIRVINKLTNE